MARREEPITGILEMIGGKKFGFVRELRADCPKGDRDPFMPPPLIQKFKLRDGVVIEGTMRPGRKGDMQVQRLDKVMGLHPKAWSQTRNFENGQIIYPRDRFNLVTGPSNYAMRVVDLVVPIGKGQRALIVAPPRTGKTILIKKIAAAISQNHPEVALVGLLVDERPEEVTDFKRTTAAHVFASSNDQDDDNHVRVSTLAMEHAKRLVEMKKDVVILLDSLTRLGRTFNLYYEGRGRTMSGGIDAGALKIPRRLFGAARNIEGGGSLTIIATALIETGSRMDEVIFQEFKGTGNAEIVLDRQMAEKRVFPAINLRKSGTRNEELLLGDMVRQQHKLMQVLNSRHPIEAMQALLRQMQQRPTNVELLNSLIPSY
ncbi:MAG: transcription termination factor Rho [Bacteroidota bacterium]